MKIHVDSPDCDCGRCEPAESMNPMTAGGLVSGNPACDYPNCAFGVDGCLWGSARCFDDKEYAE
jgi:hypothetical protein